jgi:hypothetical protein
MVCGLSYIQITKYQKRLFDALKSDLNLYGHLSQPFSTTVEHKVVEVTPSDISVHIKSFNINPDFIYNDNEKADDKGLEDWIKEISNSNEIFNNTVDEVLDLEEELAAKAKIN